MGETKACQQIVRFLGKLVQSILNQTNFKIKINISSNYDVPGTPLNFDSFEQ
jgi:hypothetical protein